jgi:HD-GYP domain-containing protein (c-di-GMP phosphodiesterase class II)
MGLSEFEQAVLEYAGLFHDVGKVGVPDSILLKPARLTTQELEVMKSHPELSVQVLEPLTNIPFFRFLIPGVKYHHEKVDGSGYPHGLQGEKIPMTARVVAIVDTVDAMTQSRTYRKALSMDVVKRELIDFSGSQFDGNMVKIYLQSLRHQNVTDDSTDGEVVVSKVLKAA